MASNIPSNLPIPSPKISNRTAKTITVLITSPPDHNIGDDNWNGCFSWFWRKI